MRLAWARDSSSARVLALRNLLRLTISAISPRADFTEKPVGMPCRAFFPLAIMRVSAGRAQGGHRTPSPKWRLSRGAFARMGESPEGAFGRKAQKGGARDHEEVALCRRRYRGFGD